MAAKQTEGKVITGKKPYVGANGNAPMRMRKMIAPRCAECFPSTELVPAKSGWWRDCPHDPYVHINTIEVRKPKLSEPDENGEVFVEGEEVKLRYVREYNWEQVPDEISVYSGRGVADSLERGWKFPEELGFAPFCDYRNCGEQNPKFRTPVGNYHSRNEAATMMLVLDGDMSSTEGAILFNLGPDAKRRGRQMRQTGI